MTEYMTTKMRSMLRAVEKLEQKKQALEEQLEAEKAKITAYIIDQYGADSEANFKQKSDTGSINWFKPSKAKRFQQEDFRVDHPDLFEQYKKESETEPKAQLRITFPKPRILKDK